MVALEAETAMDVLQHAIKLHTATSLSAEGDAESNDELEIPVEAYPVLYRLAKRWTDITGYRNLRLKPLKGAMTNQVYQCKWAPTIEGEKSRKVLVRVYGESSELFFNREDEISTFEKMSQHGQGPRLLARFPNGRVEEFLHARTLSAEDLRNPDISDGIAMKMRQFHSLEMPGPAEPKIWERLSVWLEKTVKLAGPELREKFRLDSLGEEISELEKKCRHPGEVIGFCHNDLQYGNLMLDENDNSITIIDYEYSSFNPVALDIANHFCEMAANYHSDTPHRLDYNQYPDHEQRRRFVLTYLKTSGKPVREAEVESLLKAVGMYKFACTSDIDFDFLEYARQRFDEYYLFKDDVFVGNRK